MHRRGNEIQSHTQELGHRRQDRDQDDEMLWQSVAAMHGQPGSSGDSASRPRKCDWSAATAAQSEPPEAETLKQTIYQGTQ